MAFAAVLIRFAIICFFGVGGKWPQASRVLLEDQWQAETVVFRRHFATLPIHVAPSLCARLRVGVTWAPMKGPLHIIQTCWKAWGSSANFGGFLLYAFRGCAIFELGSRARCNKRGNPPRLLRRRSIPAPWDQCARPCGGFRDGSCGSFE